MTATELLTLIGQTDDAYLAAAMEDAPSLSHTHRARRIWLIAALVALLALLAGCTIYLFGLRNLTFGPNEIVDDSGRVFPYEPISLQGFENSPNYQAAREWFEFCETYDADKQILHSLTGEEGLMPPEYDNYLCYTEEMCRKVDELCQKYGLELMGPIRIEDCREDLLHALHITEVLRLEQLREVISYGGYYFPGGTFDLGGVFTLDQGNDVYPHPVSYRLRCSMKKDFDSVYRSTSSVDGYEEWHDTRQDGTPLLLALGAHDAMIFVDRKDAFITVCVSPETADAPSLDKPAVETIAEAFDFTFQPAPKISED